MSIPIISAFGKIFRDENIKDPVPQFGSIIVEGLIPLFRNNPVICRDKFEGV